MPRPIELTEIEKSQIDAGFSLVAVCRDVVKRTDCPMLEASTAINTYKYNKRQDAKFQALKAAIHSAETLEELKAVLLEMIGARQ